MDVDPTPATRRISGLVVLRGAATGLLVAMPAAFANVVYAGEVPKATASVNISFLIVLLGFVLAGWLAGREASSESARHGVLAALVAFIPVEVVAVLGRMDRGEPLSLPRIVIVGLFAAGLGFAGSRMGAARRNRKEPT